MSETGEIPIAEQLATAIKEGERLRAELAAEREAKQCAVDQAETFREERDALRELLKAYGAEVSGLRARIDAALNKGDGDESC